MITIPSQIENQKRLEENNYSQPSEEEVRKARQIFAFSNELFVKNIVVDPLNPDSDNLDKVSKSLKEKHPQFDFRFEGNYIIHESGLVLDHKNYARWLNNPEADGYAVYARPKGQKIPEFRGPVESGKMLMDFIGILSGKFTLVEGDRGWKEKVIKNAQKLWGKNWRENLTGVNP